MHHRTMLTTTLLLAATLPGALRAMSSYPSSIPNGAVYSCSTCHLSAAGGGARNSFGNAFAGSSWAAIDGIDCDLDGQTNGQELGDPCGVWQAGQTPGRTTDISRPGDVASTSATPLLPACTAADAGAATDVGAATDSRVAGDGAGQDATGDDVTRGADVPACSPVCLDRTRLFDCSSSGQHVERPCPTGTTCEDGVCHAGSGLISDDDDDDAAGAGCGCQGAAGLAWPAGSGIALLLLLSARRRRVARRR